jgi:hypothetical protein
MMFDIVERITEKYAKQAKKLEDIYGVGAVLQLAHEMQNLSLEVLFPIVNQYRSQNIDPVVTMLLLTQNSSHKHGYKIPPPFMLQRQLK